MRYDCWHESRALSDYGVWRVTSAPNPCFGQLKVRPLWDPLRGDPRFEKIVASLAPKEN
jgi:hypothetical protein